MASLDTELGYRFLLNYVEETETILYNALSRLDSKSTCRIYPSADLGFPYDVIRFAGGFPTGILVTWHCSVPFIPIDTTINICTSSVFVLGDDVSSHINEQLIHRTLKKIEDSSYKQSFGRGNHFIVFARGEMTGSFYLILHSTASEFTKSYNGLYPHPNNWFANHIQTYTQGKRFIRYISGSKAELFYKIAKSVEPFNTARHEFVADLLIGDLTEILESYHEHHYNMPTMESVLIGSYLCKKDQTVPIFSYPGHPFILYEVSDAKYKIDIDGKERFLVPHGWGKSIKSINHIEVDYPNDCLAFNGRTYRISSLDSLYTHPDLYFRQFSFNPYDDNWYFNAIGNFMNGGIKDFLVQVASYTNTGFQIWKQHIA